MPHHVFSTNFYTVMAGAAYLLKEYIYHGCYDVPMVHTTNCLCRDTAARVCAALDTAWLALFLTFGLLGNTGVISMETPTVSTLFSLAPMPLFLMVAVIFIGCCCCLSTSHSDSVTLPLRAHDSKVRLILANPQTICD